MLARAMAPPIRAASDSSPFAFSSGLNGLPFSMPIACICQRSSGSKSSAGSSLTSIASSSKYRNVSGNTVLMFWFEPFMNCMGGGADAFASG